jgi:hypothetical protein
MMSRPSMMILASGSQRRGEPTGRRVRRTGMKALSAALAALFMVAACSSRAQIPVAHPPVTHTPIVPGDHGSARPGDLMLTATDDRRMVRIQVGQAVAVVLPYAARTIISSWIAAPAEPASPGVHQQHGLVVMNALGGGRFRALSPGRAWLLAFRPCSGTACAQAYSWSVRLRILPARRAVP